MRALGFAVAGDAGDLGGCDCGLMGGIFLAGWSLCTERVGAVKTGL